MAAEPPLEGLGRRGKACQCRQLADIALDPHQTRKVDHRADIVEHAARDRGRARDRQEHRQDAAARGADEHRPADTERREHGKHVGELDLQIVVCRLAVVVRFAATAIVEGKDAPRSLAVARQRHRQRIEIGGGPRQTGQADHRQGAVRARAMGADVQSQAVLRAHEQAMAGRRGSLGGTIAGGVRHRLPCAAAAALSIAFSEH